MRITLIQKVIVFRIECGTLFVTYHSELNYRQKLKIIPINTKQYQITKPVKTLQEISLDKFRKPKYFCNSFLRL